MPDNSTCFLNEELKPLVVMQQVRACRVSAESTHMRTSERVRCPGAQGWVWKDDGKPGKPKFGYVATEPGSEIVFRVGAWRGGVRNSLTNRDTVGIAFAILKVRLLSGSVLPVQRFRAPLVTLVCMQSYENVGMVDTSCVSGCK